MTLPREGHRLAGLSRPALALLVFWAIVLLAGGALARLVAGKHIVGRRGDGGGVQRNSSRVPPSS